MSLWKWNDAEFEIDLEDVEFLERYEKAFDSLGEKEKELVNIGRGSEFAKQYCTMFFDLFNDIFGPGSSDKLFGGKMNLRAVDECYESFIDHCSKEVQASNKRRIEHAKKYKVKKR